MNREDAVKRIRDMLLAGEAAPWKAEEIAEKQGFAAPENIVVGTMARRAFVEKKSGYDFDHIVMPEKPYHLAYRCPQDGTLRRFIWTTRTWTRRPGAAFRSSPATMRRSWRRCGGP